MAKNSELKPRQQRTIAALISSKNIGEACEKAGIGRTTLAKWLEDAKFTTALSEAQAAAISEASRTLIAGQQDALDTLRNLMINAQNENVRRAAANDWLEFTFRYFDLSALEKRVSTLEESILKRNNL